MHRVNELLDNISDMVFDLTYEGNGSTRATVREIEEKIEQIKQLIAANIDRQERIRWKAKNYVGGLDQPPGIK